MKTILLASLVFALASFAQEVKRSLPYVENGHARHVLDIYAPANAKNLPVVFWIHGGGWQTGDKANVQEKPAWFTKKGFVFVSINHRLLPEVDMGTLVRDVAKAFGWMHRHIAEHGGDPQRVVVGGHSSGAQLATLICTDDRYLKEEGVAFSSLIGCVPVDGDTYDIPAIIEVAETRRRVHHEPPAKFGHREKFGNDPAKHIDFSAVTHVAKGKSIPPFLIVHVADHPDNSAQARRLAAVLKESEIPVTVFGGKETNHTKINALIGTEGDATTQALEDFLAKVR
ncbi:MAG: alpha/beta hydrolase [Verrucomicrobiaceae bacterium]|nr:alpha/beta hydrolase [Verrucomicrobiaceae bacterium]